MGDNFLPIAAWYTGGRTRATMVRPPAAGDREKWRRDIQNIKECGFNTVRCWVDWASAEPEPGKYDFAAADLVLELAEEAGLKVIVQVYLDSAPDWLLTEFPDGKYVSAGGDGIVSQAAPGYCYDHPGVGGAAEKFLIKLADHIKDRPAFYAWDLWSEPHIVQWGYFDYLPQPAMFCYCHHSVQRFRQWLKRKYGTIEALNDAWYRKFSSWDVVEPPRFISLMTYTDYIDWLQFIMDKLAEDLHWRHRAVRTVDKTHPTSSHSAVPCITTLPINEQGSPDDWRMAKVVDVWGTSLYPKHAGAKETNEPSVRSAYLTATRSACDAAGKPYWLGELQGGHGYIGMLATDATESDARHWTWQPIAHGAKGLCFYAWHPMSSGYESAGFGLANLDGTPSERARAAGEISRIVSENMDLFYQGKPPQARTAILWNVLSQIMWVGMRQKSHYIPSRSMFGAYRALFQKNLPADFIHLDQICRGDLEEYEVLYMPFSFMISREAADKVAQFVRRGGRVIAEARTGWNDENGYCGEAVPGFGLQEVFGCREKGNKAIDEPVEITIEREHPALPGLSAGDTVSGMAFRESLEVLSSSATVVGRFPDGSPAIVVNEYGKGTAVFVGSLISYAFYKTGNENNARLLRGLPGAGGITVPVEVDNVPDEVMIEVRELVGELEGKPYRILFAFNHSSQTVKPILSVEDKSGAEWQGEDLVTGQSVSVERSGDRLRLEAKTLAGDEIWVVKLTRS